MIFYNVELKVPIGKYQVGSKFDCATILYDQCVLQLTNSGPALTADYSFRETILCGEYNLKLSIDNVIHEY